MTKLAPNIVKVGMHSYIPNAQINLRSNFNYEKLVKSETPSFKFAKVWLKGGENGSNKIGNKCNLLGLGFAKFA